MNAPTVELAAYLISTAERSITGSFCYAEAEFTATARWAAAQADQLAPLVDVVIPLDQAPQMFGRLAAQDIAASKVLVCPNGLP
jgi:threonine dehydrogenase-like Zn-dependent dehydrogenase